MIIRNKKTGETKEIDPQQASQFGITDLPPEHQQAQDQGAQEPGKQPRILNGLLPALTSFLTGTIASPGGPALSSAAAAGGTLPGYAMESGLAGMVNSTNLGGDTQYAEGVPASEIAKDSVFQGGSSFVGSKIGQLLGKIFPKIGKTLVKVSLPESGNAAAESATKEILGRGETTVSQIVDRKMTGSAAKLVKDAAKNKEVLSQQIDRGFDTINTVSGSLDTSLGGKGVDNSAQTFLKELLQDSQDYIINRANIPDSAKKSALKAIEDEVNASISKAGTTGWQAVGDLKNVGNNISKSGQLSEAEAAKDAAYTALRMSTQKKLTSEIPEFGKLWTEYGFYNDVERLASKKAGAPFLSRGDIMLLTGIGGTAGAASGDPLQGILTGIASTGAVKSVTSPLFTTNLAKFLQEVPRFAGTSAQVATEGVRRIASPN